jgi:Ca2+-binding RTX toxin-like protein
MPAVPPFRLDLSRYGGSLVVEQGFADGRTSHSGVFAWSLDFRLPIGSRVYAFTDGEVVGLRETVRDGASASRSSDDRIDSSAGPSGIGNYVTTVGDGQVVGYAHFAQNSIRPALGQSVDAGDQLGVVGATGARTGPHLHATFSYDTIVLGNGGRGPNSVFADGSSSGPKPVFETATGEILAGVVSQVDYDLRSADRLSSEQHNLTLIGGRNIYGAGDGSDNIISGNSGDNLLNGRSGNDRLYGGEGRDTLVGGAGRDRMDGGAGRDMFRFDAVSESRPGAADTISGFNGASGDRFDFSGIDWNTSRSGAQNATWIGDDRFHGRAGEMRFDRGVLQADLDGDGRTDFEVLLPGASLKASWIVWD